MENIADIAKITFFNDHEATHDTVECVETWVANKIWQKEKLEAFILCEDGRAYYAAEGL